MRTGEAEKRPFVLGLPLSRYLIRKVADVIGHLHLNVGLAHLDIKVENILFDQDYTPKVCDFGFSYDVKAKIFERQGT